MPTRRATASSTPHARSSVGPETALWRRADDPPAAHDLAARRLERERYEHTRGVAQQAARLARRARLDREERRRLLAAAWLHDIGYGLGEGYHPLLGARALRQAGHEELARVVAHHSGAAHQAALMGLPPLEREFPRPAGRMAAILDLVDIADLTTGPQGAPLTPAQRFRRAVDRHGTGHPSVRVMVSTINRLGGDPEVRALVEHVSPRSGP